ncbi:MaoC family dehydratase [Lysinimonas soli]|uniref:MaoC family dehydratase n=1 Tax=Lysinimonas soli TaxID=1074233 RepID=A0ABW0NTY7_9MICO
MTARTVASAGALSNLVGSALVGDEWLTIDQGRIDAFAGATGDFRWIHVDPQRAASGPFGATIAHGALTLSLIPLLTDGLLEIGGTAVTVDYGFDHVRFVEPVLAGSRVRARTEVTGVTEDGDGYRVTQRVIIELEGSDRPALVAETVTLMLPA